MAGSRHKQSITHLPLLIMAAISSLKTSSGRCGLRSDSTRAFLWREGGPSPVSHGPLLTPCPESAPCPPLPVHTQEFDNLKQKAAALTILHLKTGARPGWPNKSLWDDTFGSGHPSLLSSVEDKRAVFQGPWQPEITLKSHCVGKLGEAEVTVTRRTRVKMPVSGKGVYSIPTWGLLI